MVDLHKKARPVKDTYVGKFSTIKKKTTNYVEKKWNNMYVCMYVHRYMCGYEESINASTTKYGRAIMT